MRYIFFLSILPLSALALVSRGSTKPVYTYTTKEEWEKTVDRGRRLDLAMRLSTPEGSSYINPIQSPWDGTLVREMKKWGYRDGYNEEHNSHECDFADRVPRLVPVFEDLKMNAMSKEEGGDNQCFYFQHGERYDEAPPEERTYTVDGKKYVVKISSCHQLRVSVADTGDVAHERLCHIGGQC